MRVIRWVKSAIFWSALLGTLWFAIYLWIAGEPPLLKGYIQIGGYDGMSEPEFISIWEFLGRLFHFYLYVFAAVGVWVAIRPALRERRKNQLKVQRARSSGYTKRGESAS